MREYYVYLLHCSDGSYYTGVTNNIEFRVAQHQEGIDPSCYTYKRRPLKLVYVAQFSEVQDAIAFEKRVKGWSRKKKEALIQGDETSLHTLAARRLHYVPKTAITFHDDLPVVVRDGPSVSS